MGSIRPGRPGHKSLMQELSTQRFKEDAKNMETTKRVALAKDSDLAAQKIKERRSLMLQEEKRKEEEKKAAEEELIAYHRQTLERKRSQERQELKVELALLYKAEQKKWAAKEASMHDLAQGIEGFETNLRRLGLDAAATEADADEVVPIEGNSAQDTMRKILGKLPPSVAVECSGREYLERIKRRKAEETQARKERERRRRRVVVEQALALASAQETHQAEAASAALARASRAEERMRAHLDALRLEKENIVANRIQREKEYAEQREREWQEALEKDRQQGRENRAAYAQRAIEEARRHEDEKQRRREEKRRRVEDFCEDIVKQILGLTEMTVDYRESAEINGSHLLPRPTWREWKALFTSGQQLYVPLQETTGPAEEGKAEEADPRDEACLKDYLTCQGEWAASGEGGGSDARALEEAASGPAAHALEAVWQGALKAAAVPPMSETGKLNVAFKLAVTGTPFAGKSTVAKALAKRYNLTLINPEELLTKALAAAEQEAPAPSPSESGDVSTLTTPPLVALGREAAAALAAAGQVPSDVVLKLILHVIQNLPKPDAPQNPSPPLSKKGARAKKTPSPVPPTEAAEGAALLPSDMPRGFVIDGYPRTEEEARRLERALTGLDLEVEERRKAERPRLLPEEAEPEQAPVLASGLDKIFVCALADDAEALKRALGRRVDPSTGTMYHLEYNPPPEGDKIIHGRLTDPSTERSSQAATLVQSSNATWPSLAAWLARFGAAVAELSTTDTLSAAEIAALEAAEGVLKVKAKARAAEAAAVAASKAAEQVASCTASAEAASQAAAAAADALYRASRAQQEASTGLQPEETRLVVEAAAAELSALLKQAAKAKGEAETAKEAAVEAAKSAQAAADSACLAAADVGMTTTAAEDAARAQKNAESARARAEESRQRAERAAQEAERLWRKAERTASGEPETPEENGTENEAQAATSGTPLPPVPPASVPLSGAESVALLQTWQAMEQEYCANARMLLRHAREERERAVADCRAVKTEFLAFLNRQDGKQRIVDDFQEEFNEVDSRLRHNHSMKDELRDKVSELRDALWQECDARREESGTAREKEEARARVGSHVPEIASAHGELAQNEFSRLVSTLMFLQSYHSKCYLLQGAPLLPDPSSSSESVPSSMEPEWMARAVPAVSVVARRALNALQAAKAALGDVISPPEKKEPRRPSKSQKRVSEAGKKGSKKGDKAAASEVRESPDLAAPPDPEALPRRECALALLPAVEAEGARVLDRMRQLAGAAARDMEEVKEMEARALARLADWIAERFKVECAAVTSLVALAEAAVEEGIALWYKLTIQGERFEVDEAILMMERPPPAAPREPGPLPGIMPVDALDALAAFFADSAPSGAIALDAAVAAVPRIARECAEARSNPANQPVTPRMPGQQKASEATADKKGENTWPDASEETLLACFAPFTNSKSGTLSWRRFLSCLVAENSEGAVAAAGPSDILRSRAVLGQADKDADGKLSYEEWMGAGLWFEKDDEPQGFKRGAALKAVLFRMCADSEESLMTWQPVLQYLCAQPQQATWRIEAAAAAVGANPPDFALSAEQMYQLLSWDGSSGDASLSLPSITSLWGANSSSESSPPRVAVQELFTNPTFGHLKEALQRLYTWTACRPIILENRARDLEQAKMVRRPSSQLEETRKGEKPGQKGKAPARGPSPAPQKSGSAAAKPAPKASSKR